MHMRMCAAAGLFDVYTSTLLMWRMCVCVGEKASFVCAVWMFAGVCVCFVCCDSRVSVWPCDTKELRPPSVLCMFWCTFHTAPKYRYIYVYCHRSCRVFFMISANRLCVRLCVRAPPVNIHHNHHVGWWTEWGGARSVRGPRLPSGGSDIRACLFAQPVIWLSDCCSVVDRTNTFTNHLNNTKTTFLVVRFAINSHFICSCVVLVYVCYTPSHTYTCRCMNIVYWLESEHVGQFKLFRNIITWKDSYMFQNPIVFVSILL